MRVLRAPSGGEAALVRLFWLRPAAPWNRTLRPALEDSGPARFRYIRASAAGRRSARPPRHWSVDGSRCLGAGDRRTGPYNTVVYASSPGRFPPRFGGPEADFKLPAHRAIIPAAPRWGGMGEARTVGPAGPPSILCDRRGRASARRAAGTGPPMLWAALGPMRPRSRAPGSARSWPARRDGRRGGRSAILLRPVRGSRTGPGQLLGHGAGALARFGPDAREAVRRSRRPVRKG